MAAAVAGCGDASEGGGRERGGWLKDEGAARTHQLEAHLRGFDVAMMEVGYRFTELYFAGKDRNWEYAKYQAEKIETVVRLATERRPKRAASATVFLTEDLPAILKAIEARDEEVFAQGMEGLRSACMKCHVSEQVQHYTVELPEHRLSPIRTVR